MSRKIENTIYVVSYMPQGYYDAGWYAARATATVDCVASGYFGLDPMSRTEAPTIMATVAP